MSSDSTSQDSEPSLVPTLGDSHGRANAEASSVAGPQSGRVTAGWDPFAVWLHRIEQPRRRRAAAYLIGSIP